MDESKSANRHFRKEGNAIGRRNGGKNGGKKNMKTKEKRDGCVPEYKEARNEI